MGAAQLIRSARREAELTQAELAVRAGTSQPAVARYERGTSVPALPTLERILAACGKRLTLTSEPAPAQAALAASRLRERRRELLEISRRHGARNVRVFGSLARGEGRPDSDVDLLVELGRGRTLLDLAAIRREASELLGRDVDVVTLETLRDAVRREAERDAIPL